jgi:hypothetical protein
VVYRNFMHGGAAASQSGRKDTPLFANYIYFQLIFFRGNGDDGAKRLAQTFGRSRRAAGFKLLPPN